MKKGIIVITIIVVILFIAGGAYYVMKSNNHQLANNLNAANQGIIVQEKPEDVVKKLDEAYWQAVKFNDYAAAYDFFQPADQKLITKADYMKKENADTGIPITSVKIEDIRVEGNAASVRVTISNASGGYPGTDHYMLITGKWYRVMSEENKQFLGISG